MTLLLFGVRQVVRCRVFNSTPRRHSWIARGSPPACRLPPTPQRLLPRHHLSSFAITNPLLSRPQRWQPRPRRAHPCRRPRRTPPAGLWCGRVRHPCRSMRPGTPRDGRDLVCRWRHSWRPTRVLLPPPRPPRFLPPPVSPRRPCQPSRLSQGQRGSAAPRWISRPHCLPQWPGATPPLQRCPTTHLWSRCLWRPC